MTCGSAVGCASSQACSLDLERSLPPVQSSRARLPGVWFWEVYRRNPSKTSRCSARVPDMRVLFVHDHVFSVSPDGNVWTPGRLPYSVWQRYLDAFSELRVLARGRAGVTDTAALSLSSG